MVNETHGPGSVMQNRERLWPMVHELDKVLVAADIHAGQRWFRLEARDAPNPPAGYPVAIVAVP